MEERSEAFDAVDGTRSGDQELDAADGMRAFAAHRAGTRDHGFVLWKFLQLGLWTQVTT